MAGVAPPPNDVQTSWDPLITELQTRREQIGNPSYGDIAARVQDARLAQGAPEYAARVARSTVYDVFRLGRTRMNLPLVREIGRALGVDDEETERWIAACTSPTGVEADLAETDEVPAASLKHVITLMLACLALNIVGREFVDFFRFPIYLDMVGTAIAAIALGPWRGAAVGLTTNVVGIVGSGWVSLPFALVNIAGALVWGYGVRRWSMGVTLPRFLTLNVVVALVCSVIAVPILGFVVGDTLRAGHDSITTLIGETVSNYWVALSFSNIMTSTWDKLISGFVALAVVSALPAGLRRGVPLVLVDDEATKLPR